jgi:hypothetical protein
MSIVEPHIQKCKPGLSKLQDRLSFGASRQDWSIEDFGRPTMFSDAIFQAASGAAVRTKRRVGGADRAVVNRAEDVPLCGCHALF